MLQEWMGIEGKKRGGGMKMSGRRQRGRPCTQFMDQVKRDVERRGQD
jgi:hypothetical protein